MIYVGTSGWQYDDWRARFYPCALPKSEWLEYYARHFPTVEVNNSFYRLPSQDTVARWARASRDGFVIAVKASRFITHVKRLRDCAQSVELLWSRAEGLGDKLGPILFQLPPRFPADPQRLAAFLGLLPRKMRASFEFRDRSWDSDEVRAILDEAGAAWVLADRPGARVRSEVTGGWSYVRFHQGGAIEPGYARAKLRRWAGVIADLPARDVFVYFNNDARAAAVDDARTLTEMLAARGAPVAAWD